MNSIKSNKKGLKIGLISVGAVVLALVIICAVYFPGSGGFTVKHGRPQNETSEDWREPCCADHIIPERTVSDIHEIEYIE